MQDQGLKHRVTFTLDSLPPSDNNIYTNAAHGRRVMTKDGRQFKLYAKSAAARALDAQQPDERAPWHCEITYFMSGSFNKRDINNMDKIIVDGTALALGVDDRYLRCLSLKKVRCKRGEDRVLVTVSF